MTRHASERMEAQLRTWEGLRLRPYRDSGQWAIGYGHKCSLEWWVTYCMTGDCPINATQADLWLHTDIVRAQGQVDQVFRAVHMGQTRFDALVAMMYQLGATRFGKFPRMIEAIFLGDWIEAGGECLSGKNPSTQSAWLRETPARCWHISHMLSAGEWPEADEMSARIERTPGADFAGDSDGHVVAMDGGLVGPRGVALRDEL